MRLLSYLSVWVLTLALLQTPGEAAEAEQTKGGSAKSGRQLISLTKLVPELTPVSDYTGALWHRSTLFGDVAGKRQQLYDAGITFDVSLTQVVQSVVSGGADAGGARYNGLLDYGATFDTGKLGLWSGGLVVANAQTSFGNPLKTEPGNISPVNMTPIFPVPFENDTVLMEYYLIQGLPKNMVLTIGRLDAQNFLDRNRFGDDPRNQFLNTSLNNDLLFGEFVSFSTTRRLWGSMGQRHPRRRGRV
jgi:carbohydrate-selective porin OprB